MRSKDIKEQAWREQSTSSNEKQEVRKRHGEDKRHTNEAVISHPADHPFELTHQQLYPLPYSTLQSGGGMAA